MKIVAFFVVVVGLALLLFKHNDRKREKLQHPKEDEVTERE